MYDLLLTIHVLAAVLWVGGGVTMHVFGRRALASRDNERILAFSREANAIGNRLYAPLSVILIVAGSLLVNEAGFEFSQLWITLAYLGWGFSFAVGVAFYGRQGQKLEQIVAERGVGSPEVVENARRTMLVNSIEILVLVLIVIDMTVKPGA